MHSTMHRKASKYRMIQFQLSVMLRLRIPALAQASIFSFKITTLALELQLALPAVNLKQGKASTSQHLPDFTALIKVTLAHQGREGPAGSCCGGCSSPYPCCCQLALFSSCSGSSPHPCLCFGLPAYDFPTYSSVPGTEFSPTFILLIPLAQS